MAQLAIKGHPTRGNEVIEILEMLGGKNTISWNGRNQNLFHFVDVQADINAINDTSKYLCNYTLYTLESFLEEFPYKVGDKVYYNNKVCDIIEMLWNSNLNTISYGIYDGKIKNLAIIEELQPYKEQETKKASAEFYNKYCIKCGSQRCTAEGEWLEGCEHYKEETMDKANKAVFDANAQCCDIMNHLIMEETIKINIPKGYEFAGVDDDNQQVVFERIGYQYPKTYEECHKLMVQWKEYDCNPNSELILCESPIHDFCKLIVARNIYWKIAGEQMGLGKPWKPDFTDFKEERYGLYTKHQTIVNVYGCGDENIILVFPTAEMRDAFYENFKDLIENCKELL